MAEQDYFREALADFTHEAASGGAIRHLTDLGYTVRQIREQLDFPTPYARVQRAVWERLLDTGVVLLKEPGEGEPVRKTSYVMEHDRYGRVSFRQVRRESSREENTSVFFREKTYDAERDGELFFYLQEKCTAEGGEGAYASCDFGLLDRESKEFGEMMESLSEREREYILGLFWERKRCYHRLDQRMREIVAKLYRAGGYEGVCYFLTLKEKVIIRR